MFNPLLPAILGAGLLVVGALLFWAAVQNWLADLIDRLSTQLGRATHTLQTVLVILDRVMVNGQRIFAATARATFQQKETKESVTREEIKTVKREDLPADVLDKLEKGQTLQYEMTLGVPRLIQPSSREKMKDDPTTYRVAVRRAKPKE